MRKQWQISGVTMSKFPNDLTTLWNHQLEGHLKARDQEEFGWLFDVGTGKTLTCITTLRYKYAIAKRIMPTLILSPIITLENWKSEFGLFSNIDPKKVIILVGPVKKRIKIIREAIAKYKGECIFITNYEAIGASVEYAKVLETEVMPEVLILDESHRCKTHNSKRTKRINNLADISKIRFILTGTFITNSPFDAFAQFRILDKGRAFGRNFSRFRNKYFYDANAGMPKDKYFPNWQIRSGSLKEMNEVIKTKTMRAIKEDCIDLPEKVEKKITVDMTPKQKKAYQEMKKNLITFINGEAATAEMALTKMLRLCQIASGFVKTEDGQIMRFENEKEKALKELLFDICKEGKGKVIVWAVFKENYKQVREVCEKLGLEYVEGHGEISSKQKFANVERFNTDATCSVFIGHPKSVGIGINLKQAGTSIYFSRDFSLESRLQSEARNFRGGSIDIHEKITQIDLSCRDTIDQEIDQALANKLATAEEILKLVKASFE